MIPLEWFTPGEREVWTRRHAGMANAEIAAELRIEIDGVYSKWSSAKRRWEAGGPPAPGWCRGRIEAQEDKKARIAGCEVCGLRGQHECLRASGWDRKPSWMSTGNV